MRGHSLYHLHHQGLRVSWTTDQSGAPMCPRAAVAADGHRNNECPVSQRVADPVYQGERRPCGLYVDALVLGTHYRLHTAREEICTHQQHSHTSIPDRSSREKIRWLSTHDRVCETLALRGPQGEGVVFLCVPKPNDIFSTIACIGGHNHGNSKRGFVLWGKWCP